jgi:hypothetical protein
VDELRRARARAQWLHRPGRTPAEVVGHLLAVQAQDLRAVRLALRARGTGFTAADVDAALASGELVIAWLNRTTLHLVRAEDHGWLLSLTAREAPILRRLAQLGVGDPDARMERMLGGELTRAAMAARAGTEGQQTPHLIALAALRGRIVAVGEHVYGPPPPARAVDDPLAELGRRYLAAHAPAEPEDLARWAGIGIRDARHALAGARPLGGGGGAAPLRGGAPSAGGVRSGAGDGRVPPRLLGAFDPYLLGWRDRSFAVPPAMARVVHPGGGMIRAVATDDGLVVGEWADGDAADREDVARFESG